MYKFAVVLCVVFFVVIEARPKWQFLEPRDGYVPVYIRPGDTPLEEINPDLAEAFHVLPAGRSAGKHVDADPEEPEVEHKEPELPVESAVDRRPFERKALDKKTKKVEIVKPIERR